MSMSTVWNHVTESYEAFLVMLHFCKPTHKSHLNHVEILPEDVWFDGKSSCLWYKILRGRNRAQVQRGTEIQLLCGLYRHLDREYFLNITINVSLFFPIFTWRLEFENKKGKWALTELMAGMFSVAYPNCTEHDHHSISWWLIYS